MKQLLLLLFVGLLIAVPAQGKRIKKCRLDKRPFTERKADFIKIRKYTSGFTETNGRPWADEVDYNGWKISVNYSPLSDFIEIGKTLIQDNAPFGEKLRSENSPYKMNQFTKHQIFIPHVTHESQRDFTAHWEIRNNRLYLKDIKLRTAESSLYWSIIRIGEDESPKRFFDRWGFDPIDPDLVHPDSIKLSQPELLKRLQKGIGREFDNEGLIFADWFTGELIGEASLTSNQIDASDREAFLIRVRKGIVEEIQHKELIPKPMLIRSHLFFVEAEKTFEP